MVEGVVVGVVLGVELLFGLGFAVVGVGSLVRHSARGRARRAHRGCEGGLVSTAGVIDTRGDSERGGRQRKGGEKSRKEEEKVGLSSMIRDLRSGWW